MRRADRILILDGAFGTQALCRGVKPGESTEQLNLARPDLVADIHSSYVAAGAGLLYANTFGANGKKIPDREKLRETVEAGLEICRRAANGIPVALDLGPLGELVEPLGSLSFAEAYDLFAEVVSLARGKADAIAIETMTDLAELRAALLAAKETAELPVLASMSFGANGRTFTGASPETFALAASPLADAIGINCSLGPREIAPLAERLAAFTDRPIFVKANAGLPDSEGNYRVGAEEFADCCRAVVDAGVWAVGGCCGTTPEHIALLRERFGGRPTRRRRASVPAAVCSATRVTVIDGVRVIGERINPTGKKAMKEALLRGDDSYICRQAAEQTEAGADILDVNCGIPEIDETKKLPEIVRLVQSTVDTPLQIDCGNPAAVEAALRAYNGKAVVNSVTGEDKSLAAILPLVKKYGAAVIGLTVDDRGVPTTAEERIEIAERILAHTRAIGIPDRDVYLDCLTLTVSAEQIQARETLEAIRVLRRRYNKVHFALGVSNVSFGLPARSAINVAFLTLALNEGLDLPILNPNAEEMMAAVDAFNVLSCADVRCGRYAEKYAKFTPRPSLSAPAAPAVKADKGSSKGENGSAEGEAGGLVRAIRKGLPEAKELCAALLSEKDPLAVVNEFLIPALDAVGRDYESGAIFLPQLITASETAKRCFDEVKKHLRAAETTGDAIVLATVKGDVHDIGKNIVKTVLENYGYRVIDLGKNVPPETVAEACKKERVRLCGLSALMTTTVPAMRETVRLVRETCPECTVMVGGAVLNEETAAAMGAVYVRDVNEDVRLAAKIFGKSRF